MKCQLLGSVSVCSVVALLLLLWQRFHYKVSWVATRSRKNLSQIIQNVEPFRAHVKQLVCRPHHHPMDFFCSHKILNFQCCVGLAVLLSRASFTVSHEEWRVPHPPFCFVCRWNCHCNNNCTLYINKRMAAPVQIIIWIYDIQQGRGDRSNNSRQTLGDFQQIPVHWLRDE